MDLDDEETMLESKTEPSIKATLLRFDAFAILVGHQIGSGIFAAPSQIHNHTPSPGASLLVWLFSGLVAWSGAASFAELGTMMPVNGGMQEYLREIYGPLMEFLCSWIWIFAVKPPSMAMLCIIFAQYWIDAVFPESWNTVLLEKSLAVIMLVSTIVVNAIGTGTSLRLSEVFFYLKIAAIALLSLCGLLVLVSGLHLGSGSMSLDWATKNWFAVQSHPGQKDWARVNSWEYLGEMSTAMTAGLWAFGGWDNANIVAGEIRNPSRNLPSAINYALPIVILAYLVANVSYYIILPWSKIGSTDTIAVKAGQEVFGIPGGLVFAFLVATSCLGSVFINVFTTSRLTAAAAISNNLPAFLAQIGLPGYGCAKINNIELDNVRIQSNPDDSVGEPPLSTSNGVQVRVLEGSMSEISNQKIWETPINAMVFNGIISGLFIIFSTLHQLVKFRAIASYFFYVITIAGLLVLRYKEPNISRPYKTFTLLPIFFVVVGSFIVIRETFSSPISGAIFLGISMLAGVVHWVKTGGGFKVWHDIKYSRLT